LYKKISEAYPFGERKYHPYKIWLDEVHKAIRRETFYKVIGIIAVVIVAYLIFKK